MVFKKKIKNILYQNHSFRKFHHEHKRKRWLKEWLRAGPNKQGLGPTFLIINHHFDQDIDAFLKCNTNACLWVLDPSQYFSNTLDYFSPPHRDLNCIYRCDSMQPEITCLEKKVIFPLADLLEQQLKINALLSPSDTFYWLRPLIEELKKRGIPTFIVDKEGSIAPGAMMDRHAEILKEKYPPIADYYFFWNENHAHFWQKIGLPESKFDIAGQPRSDFFYASERWISKTNLGLNPKKKTLLYFCFAADAYLESKDPSLHLENSPWLQMRKEIHAYLNQLVNNRDDVEVIVKFHPQQPDLMVALADFQKFHPNIKCITGAVLANQLIVNADLIIGFQTTAVYEAFFTQKPIFYPMWAKAHTKHQEKLLPIWKTGAVTLAHSIEELQEQIFLVLNESVSINSLTLSARKKYLDIAFQNPDGQIAKRILKKCELLLLK